MILVRCKRLVSLVMLVLAKRFVSVISHWSVSIRLGRFERVRSVY